MWAGPVKELLCIMEDKQMRKVLAGFVVVVFAGLLCTSVICVFSKTTANQHYAGAFNQYPYYTTY
jgi:hypothetical protein